MREDSNALIQRLSREAAPVRPLRSPYLRAGLLIAAVLAVMGALAVYGGDVTGITVHLLEPSFAAGFAGALIAGVSALIAAVVLSVPGRGEGWLYLPLPGAVLWLLGSGAECYRFVEAFGFSQSLLASKDCFVFIVLAALPTAVAAFFVLRRAVPIHLVPVTALAGLGAAMLAAALLQLVHAHGASPADLGAHAAAVVAVMLVAMTAGRAALTRL